MGDPTPIQLEYGQRAGPRPKWVYLIVGVYVLGWGALLTAPCWGVLLYSGNWNDVIQLAVIVSLLTITGLSLMIVPVRQMRRRTVTRRSVWFPIIASGFLLGALLIAGGLAFTEYLGENLDFSKQLVFAAGVVWIAWSTIFISLSFSLDPTRIGMKLHRWLIAGSVLELLVAVPTHIVVRRRPDCCAGVATGIGICVGVVVLFVAFGPSVVLLYYRRWQRMAGK
jgi:hypothetical protein